MKKLKEAESETQELHTMTRRMILSKEEMVNFLSFFLLSRDSIKHKCLVACGSADLKHTTIVQEEVVMKRCWLARYWGLAVQYGNSE